MASKANTRAATIQDIQDENVLREMWMESQDADAKREIRSRMYKLREERLKDYYGQEGILETILKPTVAMEERTMAVTTTIIEQSSGSSTRTSAVTMSGERVVSCTSEAGAISKVDELDGGVVIEEEDDSPRSRIVKKDRGLQYKEVKASQRVTATTTTSTTAATSGKTPFGETNGTSTVVVKSMTVTTQANGVTDNSKFSSTANNRNNNVICTERTVREKRRGVGSGTSPSSANTNINTETTVVTTCRRGGQNKNALEERENNINSRRKSGDGRRGKGDTTEASTISSTVTSTAATKVNRNVSNRVTSVKSSTVTSKDVAINRKGSDVKETPQGSGKGTGRNVKETPTGKAAGVRAIGAKAEVEGTNNIVTNSSVVVCNSQDDQTSNGTRIARNTARTTKTCVTTNSDATSPKEKSSGSGKKSREPSPRSRLPTRGGSQPPKDKIENQLETNVVANKSVVTNARSSRVSAQNKTAGALHAGDEPEKVKAEQSIIRELDILDNFLSQRSTSIDDGQVVKEEASVTTATKVEAKSNGRVGKDEKKVRGNRAEVDVMDSGLEPPFTRSVYKYNCPGEHDDDGCGNHPHSNRPSRPSSQAKSANEKKKSQFSPTRDSKSDNIEDEIIRDDEMEVDASKRNQSPKGRASSRRENKTTRSGTGGVSTRGEIVSKEQERTTARQSGTRTGRTSGRTEVLMSAIVTENEGKPRRKPGGKLVCGMEETTSKVAESEMTEFQKKEQKYAADILSRPSVFQKKSAPDPNPRTRKGSDSSPERVVERVKSRRTPLTQTSPTREKQFDSREVRNDEKDDVEDKKVDNVGLIGDDDEDDILRPQKRFDSRGKGLESPGAVLKAKSLFETKAQEAAVDRSSADFEKSVSTRGSVKVSRKAALFEARSRGERVSVSSESSLSHPNDDKDLLEDNVHEIEVDRIEVDSVFKTTSPKVDNTKSDNARLRNGNVARQNSKNEITSGERLRGRTAENTTTSKNEVTTGERLRGRTAENTTTSKNEVTIGERLRGRTTENTTTSKNEVTIGERLRGRTTENKTVENTNTEKSRSTENKNVSVENSRKEKKRTTSKLSEKRLSGSEIERKDKDETVSKVKSDLATDSQTDSHSVSVNKIENLQTSQKTLTRRESKKMQQSVETVETVKQEKPKNVRRTDSKPEIKNISTKVVEDTATNVAKTATSSVNTGVDHSASSTVTATTTVTSTVSAGQVTTTNTLEINSIEDIESVAELEVLLDKATDYDERSKIRARIRVLKRKITVEKEKQPEQSPIKKKVSNSNAGKVCNGSSKSYEGRRSSGEISPNKVTTRKKSREIKEIGKTEESKVSSRRASSTSIKGEDNNEVRITRRGSKDKTSSPSPQKKPSEPLITDVSKTIRRHKESIGNEEKTANVTAESTTEVAKTVPRRKNSSEKTNELLSTRKYSRERNSLADEENDIYSQKESPSRESPARSTQVQSNSQLKRDTAEIVSRISAETVDSKTIESSSTVELKSSRRIPTSGRRGSRDSSSPPRNLDSVQEAPSSKPETVSICYIDENREISSREVSPARRRDRDSVSPTRSSIPLSTRRFSRDSCSPPKSPAPFSVINEGTTHQKSQSTVEIEEVEIERETYDSDKEPEKQNVDKENVLEELDEKPQPVANPTVRDSSPPSVRRNSKKSSSRKNSEEINLASATRRGSSDQTSSKVSNRKKSSEEINSASATRRGSSDQTSSKVNNRKKSSEEPKTESSSRKSSYSRKSSSKELTANVEAAVEKRDVRTTKGKIDTSSSTTTHSSYNTSGTVDSDRISRNEPRKSSYAESSSKTNVSTLAATPAQKSVTTSSTSTRRNANSTATTSTRTTSTFGDGGYGGTKVQSTETVTSSYGVGPTDDDGQPLFGLRALRKIKQVQEKMALEKEASEATSSPVSAPPEENIKASIRSNDMYGLRALKKSSTRTSSTASPQPSSSSPPPPSSDSNLNSTSAMENQEERNAASSPKSILKKTSSFTSNNSESKTDIVGLCGSSSSTPAEIRETFSSSLTSSTVATHVADSGSGKSRTEWMRKSKSPEPLSRTGSLSRGKVGRSSVREMSKKFEGSAGTESDTGSKQGTVPSSENVKVTDVTDGDESAVEMGDRVGTTTITTYESDDSLEDGKTGHEDGKRGNLSSHNTVVSSSVTRSVTRSSTRNATRSFLTDRTPAKNLTDVMDRMRGEEDNGNESQESDLSLLNKFIGAQIIMQGVEPILRTNTITTVSMSQSLCINGVDVEQETDVVKLKELLDLCEAEDERRIIQNRLKSLDEIESHEVESEEGAADNSATTTNVTTTTTVGQTGGVSSTDVSGELMPLILDQLQNSLLDRISACGGGGIGGGGSGGGGGGGGPRSSFSAGSNSQSAQSVNSRGEGSGSNNCSPPGSHSLKCDVVEPEEEESGEECFFDSGTESGEDLAISNSKTKSEEGDGLIGNKAQGSKESSPPEFSSFIQGLRNSLHNSACSDSTSALVLEKLGVSAYSAADSSQEPAAGTFYEPQTKECTWKRENKSAQGQTCDDSNLIEQVESVLSLLRDSLVKDPNCLSPKAGGSETGGGERNCANTPDQGKELIALIDRLKCSLSSGGSGGSNKSPLPTFVGTDSASPFSPPPSSSKMAKEAATEAYAGWSQPRPPDLLPIDATRRRNSNPWTPVSAQSEEDQNLQNIYQNTTSRNMSMTEMHSPGTGDMPWKVRAAKRRSHARSHTVGVSVEELAEARRYLEEQAMRNAVSDEKEFILKEKELPVESPLSELVQPLSPPPLSAPPVMVSPFTKQMSWQNDLQKRLSSVPRPFIKGEMSVYKYPEVARTTSYDDSGVVHGGIKLKPFRTYSLDNNYDPSKSLFTPEESVQIAIHKAAIKKQMSEEEDRRNPRSHLSSFKPAITQPRDFSLALPKPYSPPQNQSGSLSGSSGNSPNTKSVSYPLQSADSGFNEEQGNNNDQVVMYETSQMSPAASNSNNLQQQPPSPKRIENVQISLKELSSSEFPQLQIAITLNTNNGNNNDNNPVTSTCQISSIDANQPIIFTTSGTSSQTLHLNQPLPASGVSGHGESKGNSQAICAPSPSSDAQSETLQTNSKICRYKTKMERKKKMKRANTIDIPHPPGYHFSANDEDTGMEDEEESDAPKSSSTSHLPFQAKTEGDKKFLAFLEKNNAFGENRQSRPSYLSVNDRSDKFWNNRFYNLKTSFESSSQGSSPSISPSPLSPGKAPRSVSELALSHGRFGHDVYSKPVWANTDPGQLPPQVKNKLHVFENQMMTRGGSNIDFHRLPTEAWRSPPPIQTSSHFFGQHHNQNQHQPAAFQRRNNANTAAANNNSHHRISLTERKIKELEGKRFDVVQPSSTVPQHVQKPVAVKAKGPPPPPPTGTKGYEGVHMVHATASALQAMKKTQFVPPPPAIPPRTSHPPPPTPARPAPPEKSNLPWAKKDAQEISMKDPPRVQMSKALFEQIQKPAVAPQPQSQTRFSVSAHNIRSTNPQQPLSGKIVVQPSLSGTAINDPATFGGRPKLGVFGVTRSFDEAVRQKYEAEAAAAAAPPPVRVQFNDTSRTDNRKAFHPPQPHQTFAQDLNQAGLNRSNNSTGNVSISSASTKKLEFQRSPVSAFARQVSNSEPPSRRNSEDKEGEDEEETGANALVLTPVVTKVMRGPTQQRATVMSNRMSSLNDPAPSRLTNARSNIRNILNAYQPCSNNSLSPGDDSQGSASDVSPPIVKGNLQLTLPPLVKSHSGDAVLQTHFRPPTNSALILKDTVPQSTSSSAHSQPPRNAMPLPPKQEQSINPAIPRQRSLAEFPRTTSVSLPTQLTIEIEPPTPPPKNHSSALQKQQLQSKSLSSASTIQSTAAVPPTAKHNHQLQQQPQQKTTLRTFPCIDLPSHQRPQSQNLQRTSSGTSIFNRTQHLFISAHDPAASLSQNQSQSQAAKQQRPSKPPALPRSQVLFPKQFEAQMSPDSAAQKKREVEEYFRIQSRNKQKKDKNSGEVNPLRKSASHSKIMHRQRSISDGEEDVDLIFESLFKASVDSKAIKSAEAVVVSVSMSASETVECQQLQQKMTASSISSSSSTTASSATVSQSRTSVSATSSIAGGGKSGGGSPFAKFKQMDQQTNPTSGTKGAPLFKFTNQGLQQNATSAKDILLYWCQCRTRDYQNIKIENFSSSWSDGLAFCALIHHFYPDAFDYDSLDAKNRRYNFDLAFRMADEKAGIYPLLDTEDMVAMGRRPDWKCVFTYVQSMYRKLKELA